ncbi:MAG TPA: hypothetical protein VG365_16600 [Solirubrobacteraceae bacterium]|jgi:hypothetical protein|nr:hypothetical protein [Solirubrobacteraceae bacterium]
MSSKSVTKKLGAATRRVPGVRRAPVVMLVSAAELALLARDHLMRLTPAERRRMVVLVRAGRGRPSRLSDAQRRELAALLEKLEARTLLGDAVSRLSPVPLPRRLVYGRRQPS